MYLVDNLIPQEIEINSERLMKTIQQVVSSTNWICFKLTVCLRIAPDRLLVILKSSEPALGLADRSEKLTLLETYLLDPIRSKGILKLELNDTLSCLRCPWLSRVSNPACSLPLSSVSLASLPIFGYGDGLQPGARYSLITISAIDFGLILDLSKAILSLIEQAR